MTNYLAETGKAPPSSTCARRSSGDGTGFHFFVADSEESVAEACRRAGLGSPRIVPAVE